MQGRDDPIAVDGIDGVCVGITVGVSRNPKGVVVRVPMVRAGEVDLAACVKLVQRRASGEEGTETSVHGHWDVDVRRRIIDADGPVWIGGVIT